MGNLNEQQQQLILDFCLGLIPEEQNEQARQLISLNNEAAELQNQINAALGPLNSLEQDECPADLVEKTVSRLKEAVIEPEHVELERLLADEQARKVAVPNAFWGNLGRKLAVAAVFMVVGSLAITAMNYSRYKYRQVLCQAQLGGIWQGIRNYGEAHDGELPSVAMAAGKPWWKVGYQGEENHSNTRRVWLLIKGGYAKPEDFVCPGRKQKMLTPIDTSQIDALNDFPQRGHITYSLRIICDPSKKINSLHRRALIADMNPLFENISSDFNKPFKPVSLDKKLQKCNSINHKRRGQNVLFSDGSCEFLKNRKAEITNDDIYTLRDTKVYMGVEMPTCESDAFLAP